jgi:WD40 repeat protein
VIDAIRAIEEGVTVAGAAPPAAGRRARAAGTGKRALLVVVLLAAGGLLTGGVVARVARTGRPPAPPDEKAPAAAGPVQVQPLWTAAGAHEAGKAFHVGLAPDGEWLVSGGVNRRLRFWDVAGGRHLGPDVPLHEVHGLVLAPHGPRFATLEAWPRRVTVWDARTRGRWELPNANFGRALAAAFSGDGGLLAVRNKDRGVSLWDVARRRETAALPPAPAEFHGLQLSADGRWAATGAPAGTRSPATLLLWDAARPDRPPAQAPAGGAVRPGLRFSADGQELLAPVGATVRRWGLPGLDRAGAPVRLDLAPAGRFVLGPEGRAAVGVGEDPATLVVCDGATGRRRAVLLGAGANVQSVSVTRDGSQVAAACNDGSIRLWRLPGGPEGPG